MSRINLHTHTVFCDGKNTPEELIEYAISQGCQAIGFSDHSFTDIPDDDPFCMTPESTKEYKCEVNRLKKVYADKIKILLGIEQDYYSEDSTEGYDYIIGSVHYVLKDGYYIPVDETKEIQINSVEKYYGGDFYAFIEDYYALVGELYAKTKCDIVGHFDIITKYNEGNCLFDVNHPRYVAASDAALKKLLSENTVFEINCGAVSRGYKSVPYPDEQIIAKIKSMGGRLIYTSDCHEKENLLFGIPDDDSVLELIGK